MTVRELIIATKIRNALQGKEKASHEMRLEIARLYPERAADALRDAAHVVSTEPLTATDEAILAEVRRAAIEDHENASSRDEN